MSWLGLFSAFRRSFHKGTYNPLKEQIRKEWIGGAGLLARSTRPFPIIRDVLSPLPKKPKEGLGWAVEID